ncbi:hypothetical protein DAI22_04g271100 [Oryza sativa Japonica Group]|nr:hypothetical protein DAI22_04g271100 [Oryza sativa Japonica Group]
MLEVAGPLFKTRPNLEDASVEYVRNGSRSKIIFILQTIRSSPDLR